MKKHRKGWTTVGQIDYRSVYMFFLLEVEPVHYQWFEWFAWI